MNKTSNRRPSV